MSKKQTREISLPEELVDDVSACAGLSADDEEELSAAVRQIVERWVWNRLSDSKAGPVIELNHDEGC